MIRWRWFGEERSPINFDKQVRNVVGSRLIGVRVCNGHSNGQSQPRSMRIELEALE